MIRIFTGIPFLRILFPFAGGILLAIFLPAAPRSMYLAGASAALSIAIGLLLIRKHRAWLRRIFMLCCDLFMICFAGLLVMEKQIVHSDSYYANLIHADTVNTFVAVVNDVPEEKEKSYRYRLKIFGLAREGKVQAAQGELIAYIRKEEHARYPAPGQTIVFRTKLSEPEAAKNPGEFDYRAWLARKQIHHLCFLSNTSYKTVNGVSNCSALWLMGLQIKSELLSRLREAGLSEEARGICAALLTGYDEEINRSLMESFAHSGTLHVLSVSGLHTGLIYLMLNFILGLLDRHNRYRITRFIVITACLWLFALITGFSAPILRAVVMFNMMGLGRLFFRSGSRHHMNILLVSAFLLLCWDPFWLLDIGFQLSYFALAGILFFQPLFARIWEPRQKPAALVWQSITASFAATLSTLPFTLFYFKQFPLWFFVCNLAVVPLSFAVLLLALLLVLRLKFLSALINFLIKLMCVFIEFFNSPGIGYIDNIDFGGSDAIWLTLFIILVSCTVYFRSWRNAAASLVVLIIWQLNGLVFSLHAKNCNELTVFHLRRATTVSVKTGRDVRLDSVDSSQYAYHIRPHLISYNYPVLSIAAYNHIRSAGDNVLVLRQHSGIPETDWSAVTTLIICSNARFGERELEHFPALKTIVADGSNKPRRLKELAELCSKFALNFHSTAENGAYRKQLN